MNTDMNYPVKPARDNWQKIYDWFCNVIKRNRLLSLVILVVVLALFVSLMIKYSWALWGYVVVSLLVIVIFGVGALLKENQKGSQETEYGQVVDGLEKTIKTLRGQNVSLNNQVVNLEKIIRDNETEIIQLTNRLGDIEKEYTLGNRYADILILLQNLNICVEDLPDSDSGYIDATQKEISRVLSLYGYTFEEFNGKNINLYEYEIYTIDSPQVVCRAIVDLNGNLIVKGKVYIPNNYGKS